MRQPRELADAGFTLLETMVAMAVFLIILGAAVTTTNRMIMMAGTSDKNMLVAAENQRAVREVKNDVYCSSRNCVKHYAPEIVDNELRFRVVTGFDDEDDRASYSGYQVCFMLDTAKNALVRRFLDSNGDEMAQAPAEFPGPSRQVVSLYCTDVSFSLNVDAGMVTITLTNSIGEETSTDYAEYHTTFNVIPFNFD